MAHDPNSNSAAATRKLHLLYHELRPVPTTYSYVVQTSTFAQHLDLYATRRNSGDLQPEITFDDGHLSDLTQALPQLLDHGMQAHFFITVGWTGQRSNYMDWTQLRELYASGQRIGAHGWTHTLLTHCTPQQLEHELRDARVALEDGLGTSIETMSLPGGRYNRQVLQAAAEAGYKQVYTSHPRAEQSEKASTVGRLNIRGDMSLDWLARLLNSHSGLLASLERQDRLKQRAKLLLGDSLYARLWAILNRQPAESALSNELD